jgi:site-specific DNA-methyltransferase (adenine-specific)/modification methylase
MIELNKIYNEDCMKTMEELRDVDVVITSPPYNTSRKGSSLDNADVNIRYDEFDDCRPNEEYIAWTNDIFNAFDKTLKPNGCILYNLSYSSENIALMWLTVASVMQNTPFTIADCIIWKKKSAAPNSESTNKLTRICEFVFVFCRKTELSTFNCYKEKGVQRPNGQQHYKNYFNFLEAPNNDEVCPIHKATYSTILCRKLMLLYSKEGDTIYDPFMGTGTTAIACIREKRNYVGSELSPRYIDWAEKRIGRERQQLSLF